MSTSAPSEPNKLAFSYRNFRFFWATTLCANFAAQIMSVAIGWQIYDATNEADWPAEGEPFEGPVDYREGYTALWSAAG